jgi:hypothetical protein
MEKGFGRFAAIAAGVIVIGIGVVVYRSITPAGWVAFSSPDGDFSILLPGEPKIESKEAVSESGATPSSVHWVTAEDATSTFFCMYWDLAFTPSDETDAQVTMAGARDGFIDQWGGQLLSHEESRSGGYSEQRYKATTTDNGIMEGRSFIIGHRLYMLSVAYPAENSNENAVRFFHSFKRSSKQD